MKLAERLGQKAEKTNSWTVAITRIKKRNKEVTMPKKRTLIPIVQMTGNSYINSCSKKGHPDVRCEHDAHDDAQDEAGEDDGQDELDHGRWE